MLLRMKLFVALGENESLRGLKLAPVQVSCKMEGCSFAGNLCLRCTEAKDVLSKFILKEQEF